MLKYPVTQWLCAVAGLNTSAYEVILKAVNKAFADQKTDIRLAGLDIIQPSGTAIVLSSGKKTDENTLENPIKVLPVTYQFLNAAKDFTCNFSVDLLSVLFLQIT